MDGNLVVHIDLPAAMGRRDLVLFNAHLPCCDNDAGRDQESDNIAATWRDLLAGQVEIANAAFVPSLEEIEHARRLLLAYSEAQASGVAAIDFEGQMVDEPLAAHARRILALAEPAA